MPRLVIACGIALLFGHVAMSEWIWSIQPRKENGSECSTEACAGVTSSVGVVLSSSASLSACLRSVPTSCSFDVMGGTHSLLTGSVKTTEGDAAILIDLQSLNAANEVEGIFGWGGGSIEVKLAGPATRACDYSVGYSSLICSHKSMESVEGAQTIRVKADEKSFTFSPNGTYNTEYKCLEIYPNHSWRDCGGSVGGVTFLDPRLGRAGLKGLQSSSVVASTPSAVVESTPSTEAKDHLTSHTPSTATTGTHFEFTGLVTTSPSVSVSYKTTNTDSSTTPEVSPTWSPEGLDKRIVSTAVITTGMISAAILGHGTW